MHELSITKQIVAICEDFAGKHSASKVTKINLVVGEATGYIAESIRFYFDILAKDSICKDAKITLETVKPLLLCTSCQQYFERVPFSFDCPLCGGQGEPTEIGREFYVKSIEIEE
ncbi:MAG: hydrogenase maturation nickel metallochaperone HypA [Clostridiales bacterium 43-6]|nr:MAG: hydrogenase maturation nickel metallochaperone HypA [Clostridiales bacterium 43-6]